jgi:hypothetical protein
LRELRGRQAPIGARFEQRLGLHGADDGAHDVYGPRLG